MRWADLPFRDELQWRFDLALMQNANPHPFVFNVQACEREIVGGVPMVRTRNPDNTEGRRPMDVAVGFHDIHFHADLDNPSGNLSVKPIPHGLGEQALTAPGSPLNHPQGQRVMCKQLHANKMIAHRFTYHARQSYNPNHLIRWDGQSGGGVARPVRPTQSPSKTLRKPPRPRSMTGFLGAESMVFLRSATTKTKLITKTINIVMMKSWYVLSSEE